VLLLLLSLDPLLHLIDALLLLLHTDALLRFDALLLPKRENKRKKIKKKKIYQK
jgi:hypothetical protein